MSARFFPIQFFHGVRTAMKYCEAKGFDWILIENLISWLTATHPDAVRDTKSAREEKAKKKCDFI